MLIGPSETALAEGADVITGDLPATTNWGSSGGIRAYSVGTTSCNIGDQPLEWIDEGGTPTLHPVISQNLFRLLDGRFEHIGQAWLKHGFCALQQEECGSCAEYCNGCCDHLGVGCSDPYSSGLNGIQDGLGPKSEIDPANGEILVWPFTTPGSGTLPGRLQVHEVDLDPALNPGAKYFIEGHYVAHDDTVAGNDNNNASYREVLISGGSFDLNLTGPTVQQKPGISAWQAEDPFVELTTIDIGGDGRMILGHSATDLGEGMWHYEYALYNMNSDRSGQSFSVPTPAVVTVSNQGFHDVDYHSGEPYSLDDWPDTLAGDALTWATQTHSENTNANALRWGTVYNYRFDCDAPPETGDVSVGLFKPGSPVSMTVQATVPSADSICADIASFQAMCSPNGRMGMRVIFTDDGHDGETVTFTVDGHDIVRTIVGNRAFKRFSGQGGTGEHTVELTDPAGCEDPIDVTCN